jgi:hypothetical protein
VQYSDRNFLGSAKQQQAQILQKQKDLEKHRMEDRMMMEKQRIM